MSLSEALPMRKAWRQRVGFEVKDEAKHREDGGADCSRKPIPQKIRLGLHVPIHEKDLVWAI